MSKLKEAAEEHATWTRHPLRADGTTVEVEHFNRDIRDGFLVGAQWERERIMELLRSERAQEETWIISGNNWADFLEEQLKKEDR